MIDLYASDGYAIREQINKYRIKHNIPEPDEIKKLYSKNDRFLEEELTYIMSLRITPTIIDYIDYFPNLESITFDSNKSISNEDMQNIINKYPNLKELKIKEQNNITVLDISNLKNLEVLEISSNKDLKRVIGLDKLDNLYRISFFDNIVYSDSSKNELMGVVYKSSCNLGTECNIDVLYIPYLINYLNSLNLLPNDIKDNVYFMEHLKSGVEMSQNDLRYTFDEVRVAYEKAKEIVDKYVKNTDSNIEKYAILYQWMCENVKYDFDAINDNSRTHSENGLARGRFGGTNGTVNALLYGSCVCQGYAKSLQLLLELSGIKSFDIGCIAEEREKNIETIRLDDRIHADASDHSILKVNIDNSSYYSDVTWDAARYQGKKDRKYFLLSKEDISKDHKLIDEEDVINALQSVSDSDFNSLMDFATNRIKEVDLMNKIEKLLGINIGDNITSVRYKLISRKLEELYHSGEINIRDYTEMRKLVLDLYNKSQNDNNLTHENQEAEVVRTWEEVKQLYNYDNLDEERKEIIENEYREMLYRKRMSEIGVDANLFPEDKELDNDVVENIENHHRMM